MPTFLDLNYQQSYLNLADTLYTRVQPSGLSNPKLVISSREVCQLLGVDHDCLKQPETLEMLSGNAVLDIWQPLAMKYTGHQFGYYNPDLGDGRGLLLAEVVKQGKSWDLHLKGAGKTPYSRQGDGRAVLRSSIREFLVSEALAALDIPTTRALAVVASDTPVYRESKETGAMLLRVTPSHIRFGHFEFLSFTQQHQELKQLCDHVINKHYPELTSISDDKQRYHDFFHITLEKTAKLMAKWQAVGFNHGVMNTDNMSILGETFDFGPYAFLDDYDQHFICNHSDPQGRYRFDQQPNIANWNLAVLTQALLPLCNKEDLINSLDQYSKIFKTEFFHIMCQKLGLSLDNHSVQDWEPLISKTLSMLHTSRLDYTNFLRDLSHIEQPETNKYWREQSLDIAGYDIWYETFIKPIQALTNKQKIERAAAMDKVNPKYILRNYLAQEAIEAAEKGDYTLVNKLHSVLKHPFDEQPENQTYAQLPPDWGKHLDISCSS